MKPEGKFIHRGDDGYELYYQNGHVYGYEQIFDNGQWTGEWHRTDFGRPERAARIYPGCADKILKVSRGNE